MTRSSLVVFLFITLLICGCEKLPESPSYIGTLRSARIDHDKSEEMNLRSDFRLQVIEFEDGTIIETVQEQPYPIFTPGGVYAVYDRSTSGYRLENYSFRLVKPEQQSQEKNRDLE